MKKARGFSLMELMIAVAVIGILAAIAYPSYTNSLVKGTRGAAKTFLMDVAQRQQQFLLDNRRYATKTELQGIGLAEPEEFTNFYTWTTTPSAGPPRSFTARATPVPGKRQEGDGWLQIDNTGAKTSEKPDKW